MTKVLMEHITSWIAAGGYSAVCILMVLESMVAPVPSEAVMPFAGFLINEGKFTWFGVAFSSTLGSIIGSLVSYVMGYYGGKPVVTRFGRYLLLNVHDLEMTEKFFARYGSVTIFIGRFIPVVRHLISIPAGIGRMNLVKFSVYTIVGAGLWNMFLAWCGYVLKNHWDKVETYSKPIDICTAVLLLAGGAWFAWHHMGRWNKRAADAPKDGAGAQ